MTLLIWTLGARSAHAAAPSCPTDYFEAIDRRAAMVGTRGAGWFYNTPTFLAPSCGGFNFLYGSSKPLPPEVEEQIRLDHDRNWQRAVKNSLSSKRLLHVTKERHNDALCMVHDDLLATLPFSEKRVAVWEAAAKPPRFDCLDWPAQRQVSIISTGYPKMEGNFGRPCTEQTCHHPWAATLGPTTHARRVCGRALAVHARRCTYCACVRSGWLLDARRDRPRLPGRGRRTGSALC